MRMAGCLPLPVSLWVSESTRLKQSQLLSQRMPKAWIPLPTPLVGDSPVNYPLTTDSSTEQGNWGELYLQKMIFNNVVTMRYILVCKISTIKFLKFFFFFFPLAFMDLNGPIGFVLTLTALQLSPLTLVLFTFHFILTKNRLLKNKLSFSAVKKDKFKASPHTALEKLAAGSSICFAHNSEQVLAPKWPASSLKSALAGFKVNP